MANDLRARRAEIASQFAIYIRTVALLWFICFISYCWMTNIGSLGASDSKCTRGLCASCSRFAIANGFTSSTSRWSHQHSCISSYYFVSHHQSDLKIIPFVLFLFVSVSIHLFVHMLDVRELTNSLKSKNNTEDWSFFLKKIICICSLLLHTKKRHLGVPLPLTKSSIAAAPTKEQTSRPLLVRYLNYCLLSLIE